ncbi:manganese efflux pump MntP family protein [Paenibacillus sanguinis]|uniref:manganese efflux pump MntP n=1 Tax=Paenibacillus sanguinis TaxID=225906 RepID=UPI00035C2264|nr:manganese efflux pump [Paenibacillus sanguinis]
MAEAYERLGELLTILLMAVALGMDAFSLGIGMGMKGVRRQVALRIGMMVALFHVLMPLLGVVAGQYVGMLLGHFAQYVAGGLLCLLGGHMVVSSIRGGGIQRVNPHSWVGIILFSLSVSLDSFSVGVSLGMFRGDWLFTVLAFGFFGGVMSLAGLAMGRSMGQKFGEYGEAAGGAILLAFGLLFIF